MALSGIIKKSRSYNFNINRRSAKVAKKYGLSVKRIKALYSKLTKVISNNLDIIGLELAFMYNEPSKALELLENEDIDNFANKFNLLNYFFEDNMLIYTLEMLSDCIEDYIYYLNDNRYFLIEIGYPKKSFAFSKWIDYLLSTLYPTKPSSIITFDDNPTKIFYFPPIEDIEEYLELSNSKFHEYDSELYEKEPIFSFLTQEEAIRLKNGRGKLFELKISILNEIIKSLKLKSANRLWENCIHLITDAITANEADFYLSVDRHHTKSDIRAGERLCSGLRNPGGLSSLFEMIGHCWKEIEIGTLSKTVPNLFDLIEMMDSEFQFRWESIMIWDKLNYYQFLGRPERKKVDDLLDSYLDLEKQEKEIWVNYRNLVNEALENEFYDEVVIRTKVRRKLINKFEPQVRTFSEWVKSNLEISGNLPQIQLSQVSSQQDENENIFHREGDFWKVKYDGKTIHLKDNKGMKYLAIMLGNPGQAFSVQHLAELSANPFTEEGNISKEGLIQERLTISDLPNSEKLVDRGALADYRRRINELKGDIEEAQDNNNFFEAEKLLEEKEALEDYLQSVTGLMGRTREFDNPSERARKNITNQINRCIKSIQENHPTLGAYLKNSIKTGTLCSYSPDKPTSWEI